MVAVKKVLCAICREKKSRLFSIDETVVEKRLSDVIENISGAQIGNLKPPREFLICADCAVALIQTENVVEKLRRALVAITSTLFETKGKNSKRKELLPEDSGDGGETSALDVEISTKSKAALVQSTPSTKSVWLFKCDQCPYETQVPKLFKKHRLAKHEVDNPRIYQCMFCSESYQRQNGIHNHIAYVHEHKPRSTPSRRKSFALDVPKSNGIDLQIGMDASMDGDTQESDDCTAPQKAKLHRSHGVHMSSEALSTYRFECDQCQYETENSKFFKKHLLTKHKIENARIYKCSQCNSSYKLLYALRNHVAFVHEQKPRPTPQRRKSVAQGFVNDEPLDTCAQNESHYEESLLHDEDQLTTSRTESSKPLNCHYCSYSSDSAKSLRKHISLKHCFDTTEKEEMDVFSDILDEKIEKDYSTMSPIQNGNQEKDVAVEGKLSVKSKADWVFKCGHCPFETNKKKLYKSHLLAKHEIDDECIYKCAYCSNSFEQYPLLQNHIESAHQNTDSDHVDDPELIVTEEENAVLYCRYADCNKRFSKPSKLRRHLMKKHH